MGVNTYSLAMQEITLDQLQNQDLAGKVWAMPTDTIIGLSCLACDKRAVERLRQIKQSNNGKSFIVLIDSVETLQKFGIDLSAQHTKLLRTLWPGSYSVVLGGVSHTFEYLGDLDGVAFRLPPNAHLRSFLARVGPIVSTSANISGQESITSFESITQVFEKDLDFMVIIDSGTATGQPSTLLKILR